MVTKRFISTLLLILKGLLKVTPIHLDVDISTIFEFKLLMYIPCAIQYYLV